jgi:hypothetical protein
VNLAKIAKVNKILFFSLSIRSALDITTPQHRRIVIGGGVIIKLYVFALDIFSHTAHRKYFAMIDDFQF